MSTMSGSQAEALLEAARGGNSAGSGGEQPAIGKYCQRRHPELAPRSGELFPALGLVEAFKPVAGSATD